MVVRGDIREHVWVGGVRFLPTAAPSAGAPAFAWVSSTTGASVAAAAAVSGAVVAALSTSMADEFSIIFYGAKESPFYFLSFRFQEQYRVLINRY